MNFNDLTLPIRIAIISIASIIALFIFFFCVTLFINFGLREYIRSYSKCEYEERLVPEKIIDGDFNYYTYTTDEDVKVLELSDLHIGGGFLSYKRDRKTIKETITIIQNELPDLVIFNGDLLYTGMFKTGTINNTESLKTVMKMMDHLGVYYTINFGKTDTHSSLSYGTDKTFYRLLTKSKSKYLLYDPCIIDYGYTNQCFIVRNSNLIVTSIIFTIESNEEKIKNKELQNRKDNGIIYDEQVLWAKEIINFYSLKNQILIESSTKKYTDDEYNMYVPAKSYVYTHLPIAEYAIAYEDLIHRNFNETTSSKYISGIWDEKVKNNDYKTQIHYNGSNSNIDIGKEDKLFEVLSTELQSLQAVFFGGDHLNNGIIEYRNVKFCCNYSMDNITISDIKNYSEQRGSTLTTYKEYGNCLIEPKNLYKQDYSVENGNLNKGKKKGTYNSFYLPNEGIFKKEEQ